MGLSRQLALSDYLDPARRRSRVRFDVGEKCWSASVGEGADPSGIDVNRPYRSAGAGAGAVVVVGDQRYCSRAFGRCRCSGPAYPEAETLTTAETGLIFIAVGLVAGILGPLVAPYDVLVLNFFRQLFGGRPAGDRARQAFKWSRLVCAGIAVVVGIALLLVG